MSEEILQRSKILCYFDISPQIKASKKQNDKFTPQVLPLIVYHFHYPAIYYPLVYKHFQSYFQRTVTENHIRFMIDDKQVPNNLPLGLFLQHKQNVYVTISALPSPTAFSLMVFSWKRGYTIINKEGGCDHVFKKLEEHQKKQLFELHEKGHSHGLHKTAKYEGNGIAIKFVINDLIIQRKEENLTLTLGQFLQQQFGQQFLKEQKYRLTTHGVKVDINLTLKQYLEEWNYNDGFCYFKIQE